MSKVIPKPFRPVPVLCRTDPAGVGAGPGGHAVACAGGVGHERDGGGVTQVADRLMQDRGIARSCVCKPALPVTGAPAPSNTLLHSALPAPVIPFTIRGADLPMTKLQAVGQPAGLSDLSDPGRAILADDVQGRRVSDVTA